MPSARSGIVGVAIVGALVAIAISISRGSPSAPASDATGPQAPLMGGISVADAKPAGQGRQGSYGEEVNDRSGCVWITYTFSPNSVHGLAWNRCGRALGYLEVNFNIMYENSVRQSSYSNVTNLGDDQTWSFDVAFQQWGDHAVLTEVQSR